MSFDHSKQAAKRIHWQYRNGAQLRQWIDTLPSIAQGDIEAVALSVRNVLDLDNANSWQLDVIGAIVNQPRTGPARGDDPLYRALIRSRIAKNTSDGRIDSIASAVENIAGSAVFEVVDNQDMTFGLVFEDPLTEQFKTLLREFDVVPRPQGVRLTGATAPSSTPAFGYKLVGKPAPEGFAGYGLLSSYVVVDEEGFLVGLGDNAVLFGRDDEAPLIQGGGYYAIIYEVA